MVGYIEELVASVSMLRKVCTLLKPHKDATELISGENYPTSSLILPLQHGLLVKTKEDVNDPGMISAMKSILHADLEPRYVNFPFETLIIYHSV